MSWQSYVDNLTGSGNIASALIAGLNGSTWATSDQSLQLGANEISGLNAGFTSIDQFYSGVTIGGIKYMFIAMPDANTLILKKGQCGATICKTAQAYIIGLYGEKHTPGNCNLSVNTMADYLRNAGY